MATPLFEMEIPTKFPRNYYQDQLNTYMKNGISPYTIDNYEKSKLLISKKILRAIFSIITNTVRALLETRGLYFFFFWEGADYIRVRTLLETL